MNCRSLLLALVLSVACLALAMPSQAQTTWYVDDDAIGDPGPGDPDNSDPLESGSMEHPFDSIQEGVDSSGTDDTVLVLDGTYIGNGNRDVDFFLKAITVRSQNGPDSCVIDCQNVGSAFWVHRQEGPNSIIQGFTITNGAVSGINCMNHSSPTITQNVITNCYGYGGGIRCWESSPTITQCVIYGNVANDFGGGICCRERAHPTIEDNIIYNNLSEYRGGGIGCYYLSSPSITNNLIFDNHSDISGGGISCYDRCSPTIAYNTVVNNSAVSYGSGLESNDSSATIMNCIFWDNSDTDINNHGDSLSVITCCDIQGGWSGENNIDSDPLFCDPDNDNYYLADNSPCIQNQQPICGLIGAYDIGCGEIKALNAIMICTPSWGTLPINASLGVQLENRTEFYRTIAGRIDVTIANGTFYTNYRSGHTNLLPLEFFESYWSQNIPNYSTMLGDNIFQLIAFDVTPPPYNQPPFEPSGDSDTASCIVEASRGITLSTSLIATPNTGNLPFTSNICLDLINDTTYFRRFAYRIERTLADGSNDANYRNGWNNVGPKTNFLHCWEESLQDTEGYIGDNEFLLIAEDVTPPPYNQPPYPTAGDTVEFMCIVTGVTP